MNNSKKFILFSIIVIIGLLIIWGISFQKDYLPEFNPNASEEQKTNWIKAKTKEYIKNNLYDNEEYIALKWEGSGYTDDLGHTTTYSTFHIPSVEWNTLRLSHTFKIINKKGCESHYCKHIEFNKKGNITNFVNRIDGEDYTGIEQITGMIQGPLRNSNNEELIIWGEDIVRKHISENLNNSQKYIPIEWTLYTKLTLERKVFDALDFTFSSIKQVADFHPNWIHAALCIEHKYIIEGRDGYKQTKHSVFIISPKGKVKEVSYGYFSISKSAEEQYKLLFTNFY